MIYFSIAALLYAKTRSRKSFRPNTSRQQEYALGNILERESYGGVYEGTNLDTNTHVAVKVLNPTSDIATITSFFREGFITRSLEHQHIVPILNMDSDNNLGRQFIVMEFVRGGTLRRERLGHVLTPQEVAIYLDQASQGLQYAHDKEIVHRDVKPGNLLVDIRTADKSSLRLLVADFGVAVYHQDFHIQPTDQPIKGTIIYMSPEQGNGLPVPASDQYALGVVAYELLTGELPFQGTGEEIARAHLSVQPDSFGRQGVNMDTTIN